MIGTIASILPKPLHPAVVHLPISLAVLVPLVSIGALVAGHRGANVLRSWGVAVAFFAALSLSAWVALQTGETEAETVERVVPEAALESHEEAAESFLWLTVGVLAVASAGLLRGRSGSVARLAALTGSIAILAMGYRVGHSGGALVYSHGAAAAYSSTTTNAAPEHPDHSREEER
jgi:uncharacterized membrane protein